MQPWGALYACAVRYLRGRFVDEPAGRPRAVRSAQSAANFDRNPLCCAVATTRLDARCRPRIFERRRLRRHLGRLRGAGSYLWPSAARERVRNTAPCHDDGAASWTCPTTASRSRRLSWLPSRGPRWRQLLEPRSLCTSSGPSGSEDVPSGSSSRQVHQELS